MVQIPDSLRSLFSATIDEEEGSFVIEVPSSEVDLEILTANEIYRVALLDSPTSTDPPTQHSSQNTPSQKTVDNSSSGPPVDEGEVCNVTIETLGDQGDGITKVERGYVVIVPGSQPGDEPTVQIEQVKENVAFANVISNDLRTL